MLQNINVVHLPLRLPFVRHKLQDILQEICFLCRLKSQSETGKCDRVHSNLKCRWWILVLVETDLMNDFLTPLDNLFLLLNTQISANQMH